MPASRRTLVGTALVDPLLLRRLPVEALGHLLHRGSREMTCWFQHVASPKHVLTRQRAQHSCRCSGDVAAAHAYVPIACGLSPASGTSKKAHLEALLYTAPRVLRLSHRGLLARCRRRQLSCYECTAACIAGRSSGTLRGPARLLLLLLLLLMGVLCGRRLLALLLLLHLLLLLALLPLLWTLEKGLERGLLLSCCCRASRCRSHSYGPSCRRPCCCVIGLRLLSAMQKALRGWQEFTLLLAAVGSASLLLLLLLVRRRWWQ